MELRDYLHKHRLTIVKFASQIGYTPEYISAIVNGKMPGRKFKIVVMTCTGGSVSTEDWMKKET